MATALEIESWTHSYPFSRNRVGTTRWLPAPRPELPEDRPQREGRCGQHRRAVVGRAHRLRRLGVRARVRRGEVVRPARGVVGEQVQGRGDVVAQRDVRPPLPAEPSRPDRPSRTRGPSRRTRRLGGDRRARSAGTRPGRRPRPQAAAASSHAFATWQVRAAHRALSVRSSSPLSPRSSRTRSRYQRTVGSGSSRRGGDQRGPASTRRGRASRACSVRPALVPDARARQVHRRVDAGERRACRARRCGRVASGPLRGGARSRRTSRTTLCPAPRRTTSALPTPDAPRRPGHSVPHERPFRTGRAGPPDSVAGQRPERRPRRRPPRAGSSPRRGTAPRRRRRRAGGRSDSAR